MCNERVPGGQCICVRDERVCSSALSPETTRDGALKDVRFCPAEFRTSVMSTQIITAGQQERSAHRNLHAGRFYSPKSSILKQPGLCVDFKILND